MKLTTLLFAAILALGASAQTAHVVQLTPEDTAKAKSLYAQKADIETQIEKFRESITSTYLTVLRPIDPKSGWTVNFSYDTYLRGFDFYPGAFEFTEDFKFIVPARQADISQGTCTGIYYGGLNPAGTSINLK